VLGGTLLIGAFPLAYGTLLPAFYVPIVLMLFALIFRGIAFEFRFRAGRYRHLWDWGSPAIRPWLGFARASSSAPSSTAFRFAPGAFVGGPSISSAPCPLCAGSASPPAMHCLVATWLIFKTARTTQAFGRRTARPALLASLGQPVDTARQCPCCAALVRLAQYNFSLAGTDRDGVDRLPDLAGDRWGSRRQAVSAVDRAGSVGVPRSRDQHLALCRTLSADLVAGGVIAADAGFCRRRLVVTLPLILAYLGYAHWIFRGKTRAGVGYGG
jgi:cytochrome bd ubiquinol oxidase subunit II